MASPPFTIDETIPASSDLISQHPSGAQTFRDVVESWLLLISTNSGVLRTDALPSGTVADIDGLTPTDGGFVVGDGANLVIETGVTARASMGLASSTTDNAIIRADGTSGQTQNSTATIDDSGNMTVNGTLTVTG